MAQVNSLSIEGQSIFDLIYPIGSIYITTNDINPGDMFGGLWEAYAQGRTIVGAGSNEANTTTAYGSLSAGVETFFIGSKGGEYKHTLTTAELASHSHDFVVNIQHSDGVTTSKESLTSGLQLGGRTRYNSATYGAGSGTAHNNVQPYIVTYIWRRVE